MMNPERQRDVNKEKLVKTPLRGNFEFSPEEENLINEYFESDFPPALVDNILGPIDECYFRSRFIGFENFPERNRPDRPLIFASNHSGMAFPWDAMIFVTGIFRICNYDFHHAIRALTAPMLSYSRLMNPYLLDHFWKRCGGVDAHFKNFELMVRANHSNVLIYPEGVPGIGKGFNRKYRLQRFATSFIRLSLKYQTDIIPVATVNGEYINPYNFRWESLNKISQKFGIPFIPVGFMTLLLPFQPWLFYFGFPANLTYVLGKRIKPYQIIDKPFDEITEEEIHWLTGKVREQMQQELDEAVEKYGKKPYNVKHLLSTWFKNKKKFPFFIPSFWPSLFWEFERLHVQRKEKYFNINFLSGLRAFFKNPITIAFFIPILGWIPIIIRGMRGRKKPT